MTLYIKNLHPKFTERKLSRIFSKFGKVNSIIFAVETKLGTTQCFGYVEMENQYQALSAIQILNGSLHKKCVMSVSPATILRKK